MKIDDETKVLLVAKTALAIAHDLQEELRDMEDKLNRLITSYQKRLLKKAQDEEKKAEKDNI